MIDYLLLIKNNLMNWEKCFILWLILISFEAVRVKWRWGLWIESELNLSLYSNERHQEKMVFDFFILQWEKVIFIALFKASWVFVENELYVFFFDY